MQEAARADADDGEQECQHQLGGGDDQNHLDRSGSIELDEAEWAKLNMAEDSIAVSAASVSMRLTCGIRMIAVVVTAMVSAPGYRPARAVQRVSLNGRNAERDQRRREERDGDDVGRPR